MISTWSEWKRYPRAGRSENIEAPISPGIYEVRYAATGALHSFGAVDNVAQALALLPVIGVALNGTSSVLYGTVPDLVPADRRESAFGVFYTGTIGAGALSPVLYGLFSDAIGLIPAMLLVAAIVLLTLPLAWKLTRVLSAVAHDLTSQTAREVL